MKTKLLLMCLFMLCLLTLSAQSSPYLSGPGIDKGTYAKAGVEQTYKVKYSNGEATGSQNQLTQWKVDATQCDIVARHGMTASITLKWKTSGIKSSIMAYNIYTTEGLKSISSDVYVESESIGDITISAPEAAIVRSGIVINVNIKGEITGDYRGILTGTDFIKTEETNQVIKGYFTSPGLKILTATIYNGSQKVAEATKSITVLSDNIIGKDALPLNVQEIYSWENAPSGNYTWTVSNNLIIVSGQGSSRIILKAISGSVKEGSISVSAFGVSLTKKITIGVPDIKLVDVTIGSNNTLYAYFDSRNECRATYKGSGTILEYEWRSNPLTPNKSVVFLKSLYTPGSSTANVLVRARNAFGWSESVMLGAQVNNSSSTFSNYSINSIKNGPIIITRNKQEESKIVMNNQNRVNLSYELYNQLTGVLVKKGTFINNGGEIDVSNIPNGIYVISLIIDSSNRQTEKLIIQH